MWWAFHSSEVLTMAPITTFPQSRTNARPQCEREAVMSAHTDTCRSHSGLNRRSCSWVRNRETEAQTSRMIPWKAQGQLNKCQELSSECPQLPCAKLFFKLVLKSHLCQWDSSSRTNWPHLELPQLQPHCPAFPKLWFPSQSGGSSTKKIKKGLSAAAFQGVLGNKNQHRRCACVIPGSKETRRDCQ